MGQARPRGLIPPHRHQHVAGLLDLLVDDRRQLDYARRRGCRDDVREHAGRAEDRQAQRLLVIVAAHRLDRHRHRVDDPVLVADSSTIDALHLHRRCSLSPWRRFLARRQG
jgi:hypothetical protein